MVLVTLLLSKYVFLSRYPQKEKRETGPQLLFFLAHPSLLESFGWQAVSLAGLTGIQIVRESVLPRLLGGQAVKTLVF